MAFPLRQATAAQVIPLGPFVSAADGDTEMTALTIANTDIKLLKGGATAEVSKNSGGATHIAHGRYYATLDATDSGTLGALRVSVHVATALNVWLDCVVLPALVYDALYADTGAGIRATIKAGSIATDAIDAASVKADAVTKIQAGLFTSGAYTAPDNAGIAHISGVVDTLPTVPPDNTGIAHISAVVDTLPTSPPDNAGIAELVAALPPGGIADAATLAADIIELLALIGTPVFGSISQDTANVKAAVLTRQQSFTATLGVTFPANFGLLSITAGGIVQANVRTVNSVTVNGAGTALNPWGP